MPVAPDGILAAAFDLQRNLVTLQTIGSAWPRPVATVSVTRTVAGAGTVPVRDLTHKTIVGGVLLWSDNEAPLDAEVTYSVTGHDSAGLPVATSMVMVSTVGAEWGLWVKAPGRADLNCVVGFRSAGTIARTSLGGSYTVPGGPRISESAGLAPLTATLEVSTRTTVQTAALSAVLEQAPGQVVLLQTGAPEEIASGYYWVTSWSLDNPTRLRSDLAALRHHSLAVEQVAMPAGRGTGHVGASHESIAATYASHLEIADAVSSHLDLAMGG